MSKGQYLSNHQHGIVKRYYDNIDGLTIQKLQELVSDLAIAADDERKLPTLWKSAQTHLKKTPADQMMVGRLVADRNVTAFAQLVADLVAGKIKGKPPAAPSAASRAASAPAPSIDAALATPLADAPPPIRPPTPPAQPAAAPTITDDTLKRALQAFKKRLKVTRLDEESRISNRALTSGKGSGIVALEPPREFPRGVWDELVRRGQIRSAGSGMYQLVEGAKPMHMS